MGRSLRERVNLGRAVRKQGGIAASFRPTSATWDGLSQHTNAIKHRMYWQPQLGLNH